jgi:ArsR family transcriptional regulator, arsenate/arsenite/antimonite-responsive transcriptional repressor
MNPATPVAEPRDMQRVFEALASAPRRKILAYLSAGSLTAGEIAERFEMSKPSVSQHLTILEAAGLIAREKRGQFVHYTLVRNNLVNTLNGFVQDVCPVARPLKKEAAARAKAQDKVQIKSQVKAKATE